MLRKVFAFSIAAVTYFTAKSQDSTTAASSSLPTITGSVDGYYRYNFSDPKTGVTNNFTSFTNSQNSFELGLVSVKADHSFGKASATIDLGFGRRAEEFSYGDPEHSTLFAVKQAYVSYAVSDKFKLTLGKWATHIGYELVDAYLNRNYSMSYMFSYGPFSHTGLKADVGLGGKTALMIGVANQTDHVTTNSSTKFAIAQFSTATSNDKVKAYLNYQGAFASGSLNQFDVVITGAVSDKFSIGYNGTIQSQKIKGSSAESWWGSALYFNIDPTDNFGLTLRGEYFDNKKGLLAIGKTPGSISDITLSANFKIGNLTIIPEIRADNSSEEIFEKANGVNTKNTFTGILAATYHF